jgi:hypothetical protein
VSFTRPVPAGSAIASKRQLLIETTRGKTMLFLGFIVLLLIIGKIHGDNERAEQERQEQREYATRKWQQAADEDELFRLEMAPKAARGSAYLIQSGCPACSRPTFDGWNSCAPN